MGAGPRGHRGRTCEGRAEEGLKSLNVKVKSADLVLGVAQSRGLPAGNTDGWNHWEEPTNQPSEFRGGV